MVRLIWGVRFEALDLNDAARMLNVANPSELEVVGHIDEAGVEHDGPPLPEQGRYALVRSKGKEGSRPEWFAVPARGGALNDEYRKATEDTGLPPPRSFVWKVNVWHPARSFLDALNSSA